MRKRSSSPLRWIEPFTTLPVTSYDLPGRSSDGLAASEAALKLV
jgi:hypothetical protein